MNEIRRMHASCAARSTRRTTTCTGQPGGDGTRHAHDDAITSGDGNDISNCGCPTRPIPRPAAASRALSRRFYRPTVKPFSPA
jgi:hypothetical protein